MRDDTNGSLCSPWETCGWDVFARHRVAGTTERASLSSGGAQGNGVNVFPLLSADGHLVAFGSDASDLVPGGTNGHQDVFVRTR